MTDAPAPPPPDPPGAIPSAPPAPEAAPPGYYAAPPGYYAPPRNSGRAIASLVLGISAIVSALFLFFLYGFGSIAGVVCGILAVIFGRRAKREIAGSSGIVTGGGMATAGIICGWIGLVIGILGLIAIGLFVWWLSTEDWGNWS